jgi:hypothetical protein
MPVPRCEASIRGINECQKTGAQDGQIGNPLHAKGKSSTRMVDGLRLVNGIWK